MAGRDYHHEATCRIESLPENPGVRTILILLFVFTSISSADEPKSSFLKTIDLNAHHDRQVIVDREAGQYLGHPTTCLLEDGQTMLCVYPKGHGRGAIVVMGFVEPLATGKGHYLAMFHDDGRFFSKKGKKDGDLSFVQDVVQGWWADVVVS